MRSIETTPAEVPVHILVVGELSECGGEERGGHGGQAGRRQAGRLCRKG